MMPAMRCTFRTICVLLCALVMAAAAVAAQDDPAPAVAAQAPLKVFVCAGQSNMVGKRSLAKDLPEELREEAPEIRVFDAKAKEWAPMKPPEKGFGPEISFGHAMHDALGEPVGIVKFSVGGTTLAQDWNPETPGPLYKQLVEILAAARESRQIELVGMLWMQGEKDSRYHGAARDYGENLARLIAAARKDSGNEGMFFVAGRVNPPEKERFVHRDDVRKAQAECKVEGYAWVDCDKVPLGKDQLHFTTEGQVQLGVLFAEAVQRLMKDQADTEDGQE